MFSWNRFKNGVLYENTNRHSNFLQQWSGGTKKQRPYLVWTAAGMDFIKNLLKEMA
jgi:hypothetical protein